MNANKSFAGEVWETLSKIDVSDKIEKKMNLSYLSWAWAWGTLMAHYPESHYFFDEPITLSDGSCEVWVEITVIDGDKNLTRRMWLPVMDHKNNAIIKPDSRKISDTRMRCLTKCLAMFGLGHYIYAGEDLPEAKTPEQLYEELTDKYADAIIAIKNAIRESEQSGDLLPASEIWFQLPREVVEGLWRAPTKGGCFTTQEREVIKSKNFRTSYFGEETK